MLGHLIASITYLQRLKQTVPLRTQMQGNDARTDSAPAEHAVVSYGVSHFRTVGRTAVAASIDRDPSEDLLSWTEAARATARSPTLICNIPFRRSEHRIALHNFILEEEGVCYKRAPRYCGASALPGAYTPHLSQALFPFV